MEKRVYFTEEQHKNLYQATHHKEDCVFMGVDTNWDVSIDKDTGKPTCDIDKVGFKTMKYGVVVCGALVFSIEPDKESNFICVTLGRACSLTGFDDSFEDWPGGQMMVAIMDYKPEDITMDREETLANLMKYVDDYLNHTLINNEIPAKAMAEKEGFWKRYY